MPTKCTIVAQESSHLIELIDAAIERDGPLCNLNHIDVSKVDSFFKMFHGMNFNGDISEWNVRSGTKFTSMFSRSQFNGDISRWDMSRAKDLSHMFQYSPFNGNISKWNLKNATSLASMFCDSHFRGDLSTWHLPKLEAGGLDGFVNFGLVRVKDLKLPPNLPALLQKMFVHYHSMHAWLSHQPIGRYHWDALLHDPDSPSAVWATPDMRDHARIYIALSPEAQEAPSIAHTHALMQSWQCLAVGLPALALPQDAFVEDNALVVKYP